MAGFPLGYVTGALIFSKVQLKNMRLWLFSSLFTGGLTYFVLAFNEIIYFAVTTEIIGGAAIAVFNIHNITVYQQIIPNHLIGKVISVRLLIIRAVMPLGIIFGGVMSEIFGI